jgi:hypothetical protein
MVNDVRVGFSYAHDRNAPEMSPVMAVVHPNVRQRVWLRAENTLDYQSEYTSFSGFLITRYP